MKSVLLSLLIGVGSALPTPQKPATHQNASSKEWRLGTPNRPICISEFDSQPQPQTPVVTPESTPIPFSLTPTCLITPKRLAIAVALATLTTTALLCSIKKTRHALRKIFARRERSKHKA